MRKARSPLRGIVATETSLKPFSVRASAGTSACLTLVTVTGPPAGRLAIVTELRFDAKVTCLPLAVRDQPSGTFTEKPAPGTVNRTNAVLSGMSPGGLFSFAFGLTAAELVVAVVRAVVLLEVEPDPQPPTRSAATARAAVALLVCMGATVSGAVRVPVTWRSTPGQNSKLRH